MRTRDLFGFERLELYIIRFRFRSGIYQLLCESQTAIVINACFRYDDYFFQFYFIFRAGFPTYVPGSVMECFTTVPAPITTSETMDVLCTSTAPLPTNTLSPTLQPPFTNAPVEICV